MKTKDVNNAIVLEHPTYEYRWLDIWGECQRFALGNGFPTDDTTGDPSQFTMTVTEAGAGDTTVVNSTTANECMLITCDAAEYDGVNLQLKGEQFKLTASKPLYFGVKLKINDVDQTDLLVGLAETDTALLAVAAAHAVDYGTSDVIGFLSLDAVATITTQTVNAGTVVGSSVSDTSITDDTYVVLEMYWDGETLHYYQDGEEITSTAGSLPDGDLTPTINFRTGEAVANTCRIAWWRCYQAN